MRLFFNEGRKLVAGPLASVFLLASCKNFDYLFFGEFYLSYLSIHKKKTNRQNARILNYFL